MARFNTFTFALFLIIMTVQAQTTQFPSRFIGKWELDSSDDNFDDYLSAKGLNWFVRKFVRATSITKVFHDNGNGTVNCDVLTLSKNLHWYNVKLDEQFEGLYLDDKMHKITFVYDSKTETLTEKHVYVNEDGKKGSDDYKYTIDANGLMAMHMSYGDVSTKRYYKKVHN